MLLHTYETRKWKHKWAMLLHHRKTRSGWKVYVEIFSYLSVITAVERSSGVRVCVRLCMLWLHMLRRHLCSDVLISNPPSTLFSVFILFSLLWPHLEDVIQNISRSRCFRGGQRMPSLNQSTGFFSVLMQLQLGGLFKTSHRWLIVSGYMLFILLRNGDEEMLRPPTSTWIWESQTVAANQRTLSNQINLRFQEPHEKVVHLQNISVDG